jgi:uncharacterized protein YhjY with autotransporter beta-barrel domain
MSDRVRRPAPCALSVLLTLSLLGHSALQAAPIEVVDLETGYLGTDEPDGITDILPDPLSVNAGADAKRTDFVPVFGDASTDARTTATAGATGVDARKGDDQVDSSALISGVATATAKGTGVTGSLTGSATVDAAVTATAAGVGIRGAEGSDRISTTGAIGTSSFAQATGVAVGLTIDGSLTGNTSTGSATVNAVTRAAAEAAAIEGGPGDDQATGSANLTATATAETTSVGVAVSIGIGKDGDVTAGAGLSDASALTEAIAIGIAGGDGNDTLRSLAGQMTLGSTADATAVSVSLAISGSLKGDVTAQPTLSNSSTTAAAWVTGLSGGESQDTIVNWSPVIGSALAEGTSVGVTVGLTVAKEGDVSGGALSDASVRGAATAIGIDGGGEGDTITNGGALSLTSDAQATGVAVGLTIEGNVSYKKGEDEQPQPAAADGDSGDDTPSKVSGQALSKATTTADATTIGIFGAAGNDSILNTGTLQLLTATSDATGVAASLSLAAGVGINTDAKLDVSGAAVSDVSVTASALAAAIDGGAGNDSVTNRAELTALRADATATGVAVGLGISGSLAYKGTVEGDLVGEALSKASTLATAQAVALRGGDGDDLVVNEAILRSVVASADATAVAVSLGIHAGLAIEGDAKDVEVSGKAVSDASVTAATTAVALDGGAGRDDIQNAAAISAVLAESGATGVAVSLEIAGTLAYKGEASSTVAGEAVSNTSVNADAVAKGIAAGDGGGSILNTGNLASVRAVADATSVGVGLSISGQVAYTEAEDDGGSGDDGASGEQQAAATDGSDADGGIKGSVASDARAVAAAQAVGIGGGSGVDAIDNQGGITASTEADATAVAVSAGMGFNVGIDVEPEGDVSGMALSDASVRGVATAIGIDGGDEGDTITNSGALNLTGDAHATGVAVGLTIAGNVSYKKGEDEGGDGEEPPQPAAADGDGGDDTPSKVSGQALSKAATTADATTVGILGGDGNDMITNKSTGALPRLSVPNALSHAVGVAASLNLAAGIGINTDAKLDVSGAAVSDVKVTANALAAAIEGGAGNDAITNQAVISRLWADATATGVAAALNISGSLAYKGDVSGKLGGEALSDASTRAEAKAVALSGGEGNDTLGNEAALGEIKAISNAVAVAAALGIEAGLAIKGDAKDVAVSGRAVSDASVTSRAAAIGLDGGAGDDSVHNKSAITAILAEADATGVAASLNVAGTLSYKGDTESNVSGQAVSNTSVTAEALAIALAGGDGLDEIRNDAGIASVISRANAVGVAAALGVSISVTIEGDAKATVEGGTLSNGSVTADATTVGLSGGVGDDEIYNTGNLSRIESAADVLGVAAGLNVSAVVTVKGDSEADVSGDALSDTSAMARATTTGLSGGEGNDWIKNSGALNLLAGADATGIAATLQVAGAVNFKGMQEADVKGNAASDTSVTASATATGIDGGVGADTIINDGTVTVMNGTGVDAYALGVAASLNVAGSLSIKGVETGGEVSGVAASNAQVTAEAVAAGIDGGDGVDDITNWAAIAVLPAAKAIGVSASLNVAGKLTGEVDSSAISESDVTAGAVATGIAGGMGDDAITNWGSIELMKQAVPAIDAEALAVSVSLDVSGTLNGDAEGEALAKATTTAEASATGIDGGAGLDSIYNFNRILGDVGAEVDAVSVGASLKVTGATGGSATGAALADASALAEATATGIFGGADRDFVLNTGAIDLTTGADAAATAVSVSLAGSLVGEAAGKALADGSATALSRSVGIDGGLGGDGITSSLQPITTLALSGAASQSVSVTVGLAVGLAEGASVADASANSNAYAAGLDGGAGEDVLDNASAITSRAGAVAEATSTSVAVTLGVGATESVGTGNSSATARASAAGIEGGDDGDEITSTASIYVGGPSGVEPMAKATSGSTTVTVGITVGNAEGTAAATAASLAEANLLGLSGGAGDDRIDNSGAITAGPGGVGIGLAKASSSTTAVAVGITVGAATGSTASDTSSTAVANAAAISGGAGDDWIRNTALLDVARDYGLAKATSDSRSVKVGVTLGASLGETSSNSSANALANVSGISGGSGGDDVYNFGSLIVGKAPPADLSGLMAVAVAGSDSLDVGITLGGSFQNASANAASRATTTTAGIATGEGADYIDSVGAIEAYSSAGALTSTKATTVSLTLGKSQGAASSDASSVSMALAAGIDAGSDSDEIHAKSDVTVGASALSTATSKSSNLNILSLGVAMQSALANSSATGEAVARAVYGAEGNDLIVAGDLDLPGTITLDASALSRVLSTSRSSSVTGFGLGTVEQNARSAAETTSHALAIGIDGGEGKDTIWSAAVINAGAVASATTTGVSATNSGFTLAGATKGESMSDARAAVTAEAIGIRGGVEVLGAGESDADNIINVAPIAVTSTASGSSSSSATASSPVSIVGSAQGEAVADASAQVLGKAVGIDAAAGGDIITTTALAGAAMGGTIDATATATASVASYALADATVVFGGASTMGVSDASASIAAQAMGVLGGTGNDRVTAWANISATANASGNISATSEVDAEVFFGAGSSGAMSNSSARKLATAVGIDAGSGNDLVENFGDLTITTTSGGTVTSKSNAKAKSFFRSASSSAVSAASLEGINESKGIVGGDGADTIRNFGVVDVTADAHLNVSSLSVATAKSTFSSANARAASAANASGSASSLGVGGDAGNDIIENAGTLMANASATTQVASMSVAVAKSTFGSANTYAQSSSAAAATAVANGIDGGDGDDIVTVEGPVTVAADSNLTVTAFTLSSDGPAISDARGVASAQARGVAGGEGRDTLTNRTGILVSALPRILAATRTIGGYVEGRVGTELTADALGMDGGAGDDTLVNSGDITVLVGAAHLVPPPDPKAPDTPAPDIAVTALNLGGSVNANASAIADIHAAGIIGGDGWDSVLNEVGGSVRAAASNFIRMATVEVGANVRADLRTSSAVEAAGIAAEGVENRGAVEAQAGALLRADGAALTIYGLSRNQEGAAAATAYGIQGSALPDWPFDRSGSFENLGAVVAASSAEVRSIERVTAFFATGGQSLDFTADSLAAGIAAGAGDDELFNRAGGSITVTATAAGSIQGVTTTYNLFGIGGRTENVVDARLEATGVGLDLGSGSNRVENAGTIDVRARALPSDPAIIGVNECAPACVARAVSDVRLNETSATATAATTALALGVQGAGEDRVTNTGAIEVSAEAVATSFAQAGEVEAAQDQSRITRLAGLADTEFIDESLRGLAETDLLGKRLRFPDKLDLQFLEASSSVTALDVAVSAVDKLDAQDANKFVDKDFATLNPGVNPVGMRIRFPSVDGDFVSLVTDYEATTGEFTLATDLPKDVKATTDYTLQVPSQFTDASYVGPDPVGRWIRFPDDNGEFVSLVTAFDPATGLFTVKDEIPMTVDVSSDFTLSVPTAEVTAFDSATGKITLSNPLPDDVRKGDTYTFSIVSAVSGTFTFVDDTRIGEAIPLGTRVTFPEAPGFSAIVTGFEPATGTFMLNLSVPGGLSAYDVYALAIEESSERAGADAQAFAMGIDLSGPSAQVVFNSGVLGVRAASTADTAVNAVVANASAVSVAEARGIRTGLGDDLIENTGTGTINVEATVAAASSTGARSERALAIGIDSGGGDDVVINRGTITVSAAGTGGSSQVDAIGIRTGPGKDTVLAGGTISATIAGGTGKALAISTDDGDDHVRLLGGLSAAQDIELGEGRDTLLLEAGAVYTGVARADPAAPAEVDTFVLGGKEAGTFQLSDIGEASRYRGFDVFRKQGLSTWTIAGNAAMDWVVDEGVLQVQDTLSGTVRTSAGTPGGVIEVLEAATVRRDGAAPIELDGVGGLHNAGLVEASGEAPDQVGVLVVGDGNVAVNEGTVRALGPDASAVVLAGVNAVFLNRGLLTSTGPAVRFEGLAGAVNTMLNDVGGVIESVGGDAILGDEGDDDFESHGIVRGGVVLGAGDDRLLIAATSTISGIAEGGEGTDTFVLGGAADAAFDLFQIDSKYLGFELFRKEDSSRWTLTGTADGPWTVAEGTLVVNGTLLGDVLVEAPARLGGTGSVGSLVNRGTVAPGNSIGVLSVAGDYLHDAAAVLEIEVDGLGNSDRLDVGGTATLEGGIVKVLPAGSFGIATEYTILRANGGVFGTFDSAQSLASFLDPDLDYEPNRVLLTLIRNDFSFDSFARTYNQHAVGRALDANKKAAARGDFKTVIDEFLTLTPNQVRAALDALGGELHATTLETLVRAGDGFLLTAVERQISAQEIREGGRGVWLDTFGRFGTLDGDGNGSGADYRSAGIAGGADFDVTANTRLGVALGYSSSSTDLDRSGDGEADIDSYHLALYGEYEDGSWNVRGAAAYSWHDVDTDRQIRYGRVSRRAEAGYDADQFSAYLRGGYSFAGPAESTIQPYAALAYSRLDRQRFKESGAGSLDLEVDAQTMDSLVSTLGVRAMWDQQWGKARVRPELRVGWAHQFLDDYGETTASLAGASPRSGYRDFTARGPGIGRDALVIGAALMAEVGKSSRVFLSYDGLINGDRTENAIVGGIRIEW